MSFIGLGFCFSNPLNLQWKLQFLLPLIQFQEELHFSQVFFRPLFSLVVFTSHSISAISALLTWLILIVQSISQAMALLLPGIEWAKGSRRQAGRHIRDEKRNLLYPLDQCLDLYKAFSYFIDHIVVRNHRTGVVQLKEKLWTLCLSFDYVCRVKLKRSILSWKTPWPSYRAEQSNDDLSLSQPWLWNAINQKRNFLNWNSASHSTRTTNRSKGLELNQA